jgi:Leucine-rich repeat (LRR) protein
MKKHVVIFFLLVLLPLFDSSAQITAIPDPNFEKALIDQEIDSDGEINGSILTKDINTITSLDISDKGIKDFTGIEGFTALEILNCSDNILFNINIVNTLVSIKELNCSSNRLNNLDISDLTAIENLNCADNRLSTLDISKNTALKFLLCSSNQLITLTMNEELDEDLTILDCSNNQLINLEVSQFEKLNNLSCSKNQLEELDLSENNSLTLLNASNNKLTTLDVSANTYLETLVCASNQLTELNLSENDSLTTISVRNNLLTSLDLSSNTALTSINVASNRLEFLNIRNGNNANVTIFNAQDNQNLYCIIIDDKVLPDGGKDWSKEEFASYSADCSEVYTYIPDDAFEQALITKGYDTVLDNFVLTQNISSMTVLEISSLGIKDLTGIEDFTQLKILDCSGNSISNLKLNSNPALETLYCASQIPYADPDDTSIIYSFNKLDVSYNTNLTILDCSENSLEELDLSNNEFLVELDCSGNSLEELDLNLNTALTELNCSGNDLEQLDLSANVVLSSVDCSANELYTLNIKNGNNAAISIFNSLDNNLLCINVDDPAEAAIDWEKDVDTEYSESCGLTFIADSNFEIYLETHDLQGHVVTVDDPTNLGDGVYNNLVLTSKISVVDSLDISSLNINNLQGLENFTALEYLDCSENEFIQQLDVSQNTLLKRLKCQFNNIEVLNVINNTELDTLLCNNNLLSKLSIKNGGNALLEFFDATSNPNLYCIEVDDVGVANTAIGWIKDDIAEYNVDCSSRQTDIPDVNFELALIDLGYDSGAIDGQIPTSNIEGILDLDVGEYSIYDLTGIEDFKSLNSLKVYSNYLSNLDVSQNVNLVKLNCGDNQITDFDNLKLNPTLQELIGDSNDFTEINISQLTALTILDISSNNISAIDVSQNSNLTEFYCGINFLSELDLSSNAQLTKLNCSDNYITTLDLTPNTALKVLDCSNNDLETLDISSNINIEALNCDSNLISDFEFNENADYTALKKLSIDDNELENIDVSNFPKLTTLTMSSNKLEIIDISTNILLDTLNISNNYFKSINLTNNTALLWLDCSNNALSALELSSNTLLKELNVDNNQLTSLNLGVNPDILKVSCASNALESLDLSNYTTLEELNVRDNQLKEFTTYSLLNLKNFNCSSNQITALDLSLNTALTDLNCSSNELWSLNIKNGNNGVLENMNATNNPNLLCIQVDNEKNEDWSKDEIADYSDDCHYFETNVPDDAFEQALIDMGYDTGSLDDYVSTTSINTITELNLSVKGIDSLNGIEDFKALQILNISGNQIESIDLSNNVDLIELNASNNSLINLDLSNNSGIEILDVSSNELSELYISNLSNLTSLACHTNQLVDLDMSMNNALAFLDCSSNQLFTLNIRNGNNSMLSVLNAINNADLTCIEADSESPPDGVTWQKDNTASYGLNCHYYQTYVPDDAFEVALDPNGELDDYVSTKYLNQLTSLIIDNLGVLDLTGLEAIVNLKTFSCGNNNITSLNLSKNLFLERLDCSSNDIVSMDVSHLNYLTYLNMSNNNLTVIDVSSNPNIKTLDLSNNDITSLDVTSNVQLIRLNCSSNQLSSLHINNGFNENLMAFDSRNNPLLTCILVDDQNTVYTNWYKDPWSGYKLICDDDDNDGVSNDDDLCPGTPFGEPVDLFGCSFYSLSNDNFTILITGETCLSSNNGKVYITAEETYNYTATITGIDYLNSYKFTNDVEIRNLRQGTYQLCITVDEWSGYSSCYDIVISEPEPLAVLTSKSTKNKKVSLDMSGNSNYHIDFNGFKFSTSDSNIDLSLKNGYNSIKVSTDLDCQGIYEEQIYMSDGVFVYPNPFDNAINIYLGSSEVKNTEINIYSSLGQLVYTQSLKEHQDTYQIVTSKLPIGLYIVSIKTKDSVSTFKIVKK